MTDDGARFVPRCEECGGYASFGFGVRLRTGHTGIWFCKEHKPEIDPIVPLPPERALLRKEGQAQLL